MSYDNSINSKTILLIVILIILLYIILYKSKEKRENIENNNIINLERNLAAQYNYDDVEFWSFETGGHSGSNWGKDKQITTISNLITNTVVLIQLDPLEFKIYTLNDNKLYIIKPKTNIILEKIISDTDLNSSKINIRDSSNNILKTIDRYPEIDGIKLKNDLINTNLFLESSENIDTSLLLPSKEFGSSQDVSMQPMRHRSPLEEIFIDDKLTVEPNLFNLHKKCLNDKANTIQKSLNELAIYTKEFQEKNKDATSVSFVLNENTRDKIRNVIKNFKNITESEFDCLYVNKDAPLNVCNIAQNIRESDSNQFINMLNQIILAEKFIILYHNEIIDFKTIVLPKIIHFITVCDKIKKEDKKNLLNLLKKIINIVNYVAYIIGGNNKLITQIDKSLKSIV